MEEAEGEVEEEPIGQRQGALDVGLALGHDVATTLAAADNSEKMASKSGSSGMVARG